uniref:Secreted protein n=1 Tax=Globodera pallida TaxID=36090 RepID=A0A183CRR5_GLOPA
MCRPGVVFVLLAILGLFACCAGAGGRNTTKNKRVSKPPPEYLLQGRTLKTDFAKLYSNIQGKGHQPTLISHNSIFHLVHLHQQRIRRRLAVRNSRSRSQEALSTNWWAPEQNPYTAYSPTIRRMALLMGLFGPKK